MGEVPGSHTRAYFQRSFDPRERRSGGADRSDYIRQVNQIGKSVPLFVFIVGEGPLIPIPHV